MRFEEKAARYHPKASIQKKVADWVSEWIETDCSGLSGLELGAGTGLFTRHLGLRDFKDFRATDIAESMLEEGKRRLPALKWEKQDAWFWDERTVDRIYSCSLLQWASEPDKVLSNWVRMLHPKGRVLAGLFVVGSLREFVNGVEGFSALEWRSSDEWTSLFEGAGFRVVRVESRSDAISYSSPREALRAIHDIGAISERRMSGAALRRCLSQLEGAQSPSFDVSWESIRLECEVR